MAIRPIFLFSVSRSGSTLVQRVIAAHDGVATVSEPWLLMPYAYALRRQGVRAEYVHHLMVAAISDFTRQLPDGVEDYRRETRELALRLYAKAAGRQARYFVDKSPYNMIADEIIRLFPEGKFVFLWRNPLSIMASIIDTVHGGRWSPTVCRNDLFIGLPRLISAYLGNASTSYSVRFEDLLDHGDDAWRKLMSYLGIAFEPQSLQRFREVRLAGRMGDQVGVRRYVTLSKEPEHKWKATLANPVRKAWCRRYLRFLGEQRLAAIGYDSGQLLKELDSQASATRCLAADVTRLAIDIAKEPVRVRMRRREMGGPNVIRELLAA